MKVYPVPKWLEWLAALATLASFVLSLTQATSLSIVTRSVLLLIGILGLCYLGWVITRRIQAFERERILERLTSVTTRLHPDKQDLTRRTFEIVFLEDQKDLSSRLRDLASTLRGLGGRRLPGEPPPFFPAVLHLFLSTILFGKAGIRHVDAVTISAVAECYSSLIDQYLDMDRIQLLAEHCAVWLAGWNASQDVDNISPQWIAHESMRLLIPSILLRLYKSPDPSIVIRVSKSFLKLGTTIVHQSELMMKARRDHGLSKTQADMFDLSYGLLIDLVATCRSDLSENLEELVERMFPDEIECWARWEESERNPLGKIGFKWEQAAKDFVGKLSGPRKQAYCAKLRSKIDRTFPNLETAKLKALRAYLAADASRQSAQSNEP